MILPIMLFFNNYFRIFVSNSSIKRVWCTNRGFLFEEIAQEVTNITRILDKEYYGLQCDMFNFESMTEHLKNYNRYHYNEILRDTNCDDDGSYQMLLGSLTNYSGVTSSYRVARDKFVSLFNQSPFRY